MTKVDILLATYNGEAFIQEQINSLLDQTHSNFQLIIRDDGSTDSTRGIIEEYCTEYPGKIKAVFDGVNLGTPQNFSKLMEFATSDYIMFCDQDDVWKKDKVAKTLAAMQQLETELGKATPLLVHTDLCVVDKDLKELSPSFLAYLKLKPNNDTLNRIVVQNIVTGSTVMMNRSLLELSRPIHKDALMHDWWVAHVASAFGKIVFIPEATLYYRQHGKNQIGAKKYTFSHLVNHTIKMILNSRFWKNQIVFCRKRKQIEAFHEMFHVRLSSKQNEMIKAYLNLPYVSYFTSRFQLMKFGFFRSELITNIGIFLFLKQP